MGNIYEIVHNMQKGFLLTNRLSYASDFAATLVKSSNFMNLPKDLSGLAAINKNASINKLIIPKVYRNYNVDALGMIYGNKLAINSKSLFDSMRHITQIQDNIILGFSNIEKICNIQKNMSGVGELLANLSRTFDTLKYKAFGSGEAEEVATVAEVYQMLNLAMPKSAESDYVTKEDLQNFKLEFIEFFKNLNTEKKNKSRTFDEWVMLVAAFCALIDYLIKAINSFHK